MEQPDMEKTEPVTDLEKTQEFVLSPEAENGLERLIDDFRSDALEQVRGKVIEYQGRRFICTDVSGSLDMTLQDPDTGAVRRVPYRGK